MMKFKYNKSIFFFMLLNNYKIMDVNIYRNNYKDLVYMNVCLLNIGFLISLRRKVLKWFIKFIERNYMII